MKRLLLIGLCCACLFVLTRRHATGQESDLGIGSKAPALDVEHWIQTGNGYFEPVQDFKDGKVYVVEFWATWCGPCIESMPDLAELQQRYRGEGVQIISITDEPLDVVKAFLERENERVGKTFDEITSAYSLTADPDGSAHTAFMDASGQMAIPTSFIVGKTGLIEWIGHPMEIDEPLRQVVDGTWDREAFREKLEREREIRRIYRETRIEVSELAGSGKVDQALQLLETRIEQSEYEELTELLKSFLHAVRVTTDRINSETVDYYRAQLEAAKADSDQLAEFGDMIRSFVRQGADLRQLPQETIRAVRTKAEQVDGDAKLTLYIVLTELHAATGQADAAIESLKKAIDVAEGDQKQSLQESLEDFLQQVAAAEQDAAAEENTTDQDQDKPE